MRIETLIFIFMNLMLFLEKVYNGYSLIHELSKLTPATTYGFRIRVRFQSALVDVQCELNTS